MRRRSPRSAVPNGAVVDRGAEDDSSAGYEETQEDVLDEIALHYAAPYRL